MPLRRNSRVVGCTVGLVSMLLLASAGSAFGSASVRFVHAVPGAGPAALNVSVDGAGSSGAAVSFGSVSRSLEVDAGDAKLTVAPADGSKALAEAEETLDDDASYTAVALPTEEGDGADLRLYRDEKPREGKALMRAIQAA